MFDIKEYFNKNFQQDKLESVLENAINFYGNYIKKNLIENNCELLLSDKKNRRRGGDFSADPYRINLYKVRENLEKGTVDCIYVHELAHFLDKLRRPEYSRYRFASSSRSSRERTIIILYRSKMIPFPEKRTNYRGRTCELFARSIEEYYAIKTNNTNWIEIHRDWDYYVDIEEFKKTIYPIVEDYMEYIRTVK